MVFVNQVAEIVHTIVDTWHGAANRNIGDAFLIVWRMRDNFNLQMRAKMAEMSVISFVQVVAAINKSAVLKEYREHPALLARLPNYRVRMGFGLHYGWAIEGAIGSEFKIDASYLSPHVNMASRLEAATKQYQVLILMSEPLTQLCRPEMVRHYRTVDHVTLKGGMSAPIRLHTVDLNGEILKTDKVNSKKSVNQFELRMQREKAQKEKMQDSFMVHAIFEKDADIITMRKQYPLSFFQLFAKGYLNYEAGEWDVARRVFEQTRDMLGECDGPSKALLDFMSTFKFDSSKVTPKGWPGYRELTEM
jgi:class 3 adenylate cyclase